MLLELIGSFNRYSIGLVILAVKYADIVVTCLILLCHTCFIRLRLVVDTLMLSLNHSTDCLLLSGGLLELIDIEIHFSQGARRGKVARETCQEGISNTRIS